MKLFVLTLILNMLLTLGLSYPLRLLANYRYKRWYIDNGTEECASLPRLVDTLGPDTVGREILRQTLLCLAIIWVCWYFEAVIPAGIVSFIAFFFGISSLLPMGSPSKDAEGSSYDAARELKNVLLCAQAFSVSIFLLLFCIPKTHAYIDWLTL